jgi:hypothetical protein
MYFLYISWLIDVVSVKFTCWSLILKDYLLIWKELSVKKSIICKTCFLCTVSYYIVLRKQILLMKYEIMILCQTITFLNSGWFYQFILVLEAISILKHSRIRSLSQPVLSNACKVYHENEISRFIEKINLLTRRCPII